MGDDLKISGPPTTRRQVRIVEKIVVHEKYDSADVPNNDIALIIVEVPFVQTNTFRPVNVTEAGPADDEPCRVGNWTKCKYIAIKFNASFVIISFVAGWGKIDPDVEDISEELMAVNITVIPMEICNGTISYNGEIPNGTICAGYMPGGRDSCQVKSLKNWVRNYEKKPKLIELNFFCVVGRFGWWTDL